MVEIIATIICVGFGKNCGNQGLSDSLKRQSSLDKFVIKYFV